MQYMPHGAPMPYGAVGQGSPLTAAPGQIQMVSQASLYKMLESLPAVKIDEQINVMQNATRMLGQLAGEATELGMANKYLISTPHGHPILFAVEKSDFLSRNCLPDCRAIDIDILALGQDPRLISQAIAGVDWNVNPFSSGLDFTGAHKFLRLHKDFQCTCCCLNRPVIQVSDGATGKRLGSIRDPFACCDLTFGIDDASGTEVIKAKGGCCQLGMVCPCPCGPCQKVRFDVDDANTGHSVGHLERILPPEAFFLGSSASKYDVDFGQVAHPEWKALLIALGLFIDYRYFNQSRKNTKANEP